METTTYYLPTLLIYFLSHACLRPSTMLYTFTFFIFSFIELELGSGAYLPVSWYLLLRIISFLSTSVFLRRILVVPTTLSLAFGMASVSCVCVCVCVCQYCNWGFPSR